MSNQIYEINYAGNNRWCVIKDRDKLVSLIFVYTASVYLMNALFDA